MPEKITYAVNISSSEPNLGEPTQAELDMADNLRDCIARCYGVEKADVTIQRDGVLFPE